MLTQWERLPDSWIALHPQSAFSALSAHSDDSGLWLAVKRPLFIAFVIGCIVTLIAWDAFNPRLLASTTLCWGLVPLSEALGLLVIIGTDRGRLSLSQASDLFFTGHTPWLLWFAVFGLLWSSQPPPAAAMFPSPHTAAFALGTVVTMLWSLYIDYCFFRFALRRTRARAAVSLALQRLVSWSLILLIIEWAAVACGVFHTQAR